MFLLELLYLGDYGGGGAQLKEMDVYTFFV